MARANQPYKNYYIEKRKEWQMVFRAFRKTVKTPKERRFLPYTVPMLPPENALPRAENSGWSFRRFSGTAK